MTWRRVLASRILTPCARILVVGTGITMHEWKERFRSKMEGRYWVDQVEFSGPLIGRSCPDVIRELGNTDPFGELEFAS